MQVRKASPTSRKQIRDFARVIRRLEGAENSLYFNILHFVEVTLPRFIPDFSFQVKEYWEMGEDEGLTFPDEGIIQIRSDVYSNAIEDDGRARLTIAHELYHLFHHEKINISFARTSKNEKILTYEDPEWQADAFGGELLVPHHLIGGMGAVEISRNCKVSFKAASYQLRKYYK